MNISTQYGIAITGTFDVENYGDLMFPIIAEYELSRRLGSINLTRYSYHEKVRQSWPYDVTPLSRLDEEIANHSGLLIGGGHLIRFDKEVAEGYGPSDAQIHHPASYWLAPALAASTAGVPIYWNSPSASLNTPNWGIPLLKAALSLSEYVSVRDESTASELRRIGYSGQCAIVPDTVFGLPYLLPLEQARTRAAPLLEKAGITGPYIVIQAKPELGGIAKALASHPDTQGLQILVVEIGPILGEHASLVTDAIPGAKYLDFWPEPLDIAALIAASAGSVAISLHLTITSLCYGLPVLRYSRYRLTKYEFIEASKNVFLHEGDEAPLPPAYLAHLTQRRPCSIALQAKSVLDAHWEQISRSIAGTRHRRPKHAFIAWNAAVAQAERFAQDSEHALDTLHAETAALQEMLATRNIVHTEHEQPLATLIRERNQARETHELLTARCAQLEAQAAEKAQNHHAEVKALHSELNALRHALADVLEGNKALLARHDQTRESVLAIHDTFEKKERILRRLQLEQKEEKLALEDALTAQKTLNADMLKTLDAIMAAYESLKQSQHDALHAMRHVVAERDAHIQDILRSRSWRLTRLLRSVTTAARGIRNRIFSSKPAQIPEVIFTEVAEVEPLLLTDASSELNLESIPDIPFDEAFYLDNYPDIAASGMDPYLHYIQHGRAEGRLGVPPPLKLSENPEATHVGRDFVLVVCHDASRTGAPILGWNICRELGRRYNVITLLLGDGDLLDYFLNDSAAVAGPYDPSVRTPKAIGRTISDIQKRFSPAFAIVNSIASRSVLRPLAENYIPSVLLVHEFSKFHCHPDEIVDTLGWAGEVVFPATIVRNNAILDRTLPAIRRAHIVPQGRSMLPTPLEDSSAAALGEIEQEREALIRKVFARGKDAEKTFVILGAGTIEYRKGVDLFIATAEELKRIAPERKILMVWVGRTYDTAELHQYRRFLDEQILISDLPDRAIILDETPHLDVLYRLADVFFVSARLDPLPNVAIDAMTLGTPVICFDNATGVAEILAGNPATESCVVPAHNVNAAAQTILGLTESETMHQRLSQACKLIAAETFDLPRYTKTLESLALDATTATYRRRADESALADRGGLVSDFYRARRSPDAEDLAARVYLKHSQSRIYTRKPAPGFDPAAYAAQNNLTACDPDPYLHWLRSGQPKGPWQIDILHLAQADLQPTKHLRIGVHVHAYYPELLPSILGRMELNKLQCDYLISVPTNKAVEEVGRILDFRPYQQRCLVRQTINRGRDIGPFFTEFADELIGYDVVGHFHTKKSPHVTLSNLVPDWIEFLLENMIGGEYRAADAIITALSKDERLGLVFADDPHLIGWDQNLKYATALAQRIGMSALREGFFPFPVGTMFWARPQALAPLFDLRLDWEEYPSEPLPIDGSMLHALERLLPMIADFAGYKSCATYAPRINR